MRRDVLAAYAASGAKVLSWVIVSAIVFRAGVEPFAVLALVRGTLGLLNYTTVGLAPALVRLLAEAGARPRPVLPADEPAAAGTTLSYAPGSATHRRLRDPVRAVYLSGVGMALIAGAVGVVVLVVYSHMVGQFHYIPPSVTAAPNATFLIGLGVIFRLVSDAPAAAIQTAGGIARDSLLLVVAEVTWVALAPLWHLTDFGFVYRADMVLYSASLGYAASGLLLLGLRAAAAARVVPLTLADRELFNWDDFWRLLGVGSLVAFAQLADFLYAPTDYVLINRLISADAVATYAPAVQIDAGLLIAVAALSAVLLPKAAVAHVAGDVAALRRYFVRGTLASAALLLLAGAAVYALSGWIFRIWLGNPMHATQAVLPLVLVHTVVGGSSGVGRSILLGMGKVKPFAIAALVAGTANVMLSYVFVRYFDLGLKGIIYGTIVAVVARCVIWQPWYVLRTLRREAGERPVDTSTLALPPEPL